MIVSAIFLSYLIAAGVDDPVSTTTQLAAGSPLLGPLATVAAILITAYLSLGRVQSIRKDKLRETMATNEELRKELTAQHTEIAALRKQVSDTEKRLSIKIQDQSREHTEQMEALFKSQEKATRDHQEEVQHVREEYQAELEITRAVHEAEMKEERGRTREAQNENLRQIGVVHALREFIMQNGLTPPCFD